MGAREATAFALLPIVLGAIVFLPHWVYLGMVWVFTLLAARELLVLFRRLSHPAPLWPPLVVLALLLPALWLAGLAWTGPLLGVSVLVIPLVYLLGRYPIQGASAAVAGASFTVAYFLATGGAMGLLRTAFPGTLGIKVVIVHCIGIWAGDTGAYYLGTRFGRHKLAPRVSPKKSWEGVAGGVLLTAVGVWLCRTVFMPELPARTAVALVVLLSVLAPLGDLAESLFKRDAGVKDSSDLIPGHGGFLDRVDSLFFAAPFVLALFLVLGVAA